MAIFEEQLLMFGLLYYWHLGLSPLVGVFGGQRDILGVGFPGRMTWYGYMGPVY
jgi:hypothetical protein